MPTVVKNKFISIVPRKINPPGVKLYIAGQRISLSIEDLYVLRDRINMFFFFGEEGVEPEDYVPQTKPKIPRSFSE